MYVCVNQMLAALFDEGGADVIPSNSFMRTMESIVSGTTESFGDENQGDDNESAVVDAVIVPESKFAREPILSKLAVYLKKKSAKTTFVVVSQEFFVDWIAKPSESILPHVLLTKSAADIGPAMKDSVTVLGDGNCFPRKLVETARQCRGTF